MYLPVRGGGSVGTESQKSLESGHWFATPVVSEHKLVDVDLQLRAADSMVRSDEPVLKIADCPVRIPNQLRARRLREGSAPAGHAR